jgi:putative addiction module component (TIGR02574 family)
MSTVEELLAAVMRLPRAERARVAEELLCSFDEPANEVSAAWAAELERRSREVAEGRVQTVAWDTVRTDVLKEIAHRRAGRSSS